MPSCTILKLCVSTPTHSNMDAAKHLTKPSPQSLPPFPPLPLPPSYPVLPPPQFAHHPVLSQFFTEADFKVRGDRDGGVKHLPVHLLLQSFLCIAACSALFALWLLVSFCILRIFSFLFTPSRNVILTVTECQVLEYLRAVHVEDASDVKSGHSFSFVSHVISFVSHLISRLKLISGSLEACFCSTAGSVADVRPWFGCK